MPSQGFPFTMQVAQLDHLLEPPGSERRACAAAGCPKGTPAAQPVSLEKQKPAASEKADEPSLAELLLGLLVKGENEDPEAPPPRIRNREDYEAALEQRKGPTAALPANSEAAG